MINRACFNKYFYRYVLKAEKTSYLQISFSKNVGHRGWPTMKNKKNTLKQSSEERNLDQNINDSKTHICNSFFFFLKILFRAYNFSPHVPVDIIRVFFIPEFVAENLKANKNQRKISLILQYSFVQKATLIYKSQLLWNWK